MWSAGVARLLAGPVLGQTVLALAGVALGAHGVAATASGAAPPTRTAPPDAAVPAARPVRSAVSARPDTASDAARGADSLVLVTSDLRRFWAAYDAAQRTADSAARVHLYRDRYLRGGSPALAEWMITRLADGDAVAQQLVERGGWTTERIERAWAAPAADSAHQALIAAARPHAEQSAAEQLAAAVARRPQFYAAMRAPTLALDTARAALAALDTVARRLRALYPDAALPPVHVLIGRLSTGGAASASGVLIGGEMYAADSTTPREELSAWERGNLRGVRDIPRLVAHELAHVQQTHARRTRAGGPVATTLLAASLDEGCADMMADLLVGPGAPNAYGLARERALWAEFRPVMRGSDMKGWLYQGDAATGRPADLGYFVGARICRAYYDRAPDKARALGAIFRLDDPEALLAASRYAP